MPILNWSLVSPFGIQPAGTQGDVWHAGHVTDVLLLDDQNILVAAETGGVWRLSSNGDATPLSHSWDNPDVRCLAFGPDYRNQVFAGCKSSSGIGALWVTDHTAQGDPLLAWNRVALPGVTGSIFCVLVLLDSGRIVIGTQRGIWWAHLQDDPTAYPWVRPQWAGHIVPPQRFGASIDLPSLKRLSHSMRLCNPRSRFP